MTAKTRRLRELIASGEFLYMPSATTPLEGRLAETIGDAARLHRRLCQRRLARDHRAAADDGRAGAGRRRGGAGRRRCRWSPMPAPASASRCTRCARCASSPPPGSPASISRTSSIPKRAHYHDYRRARGPAAPNSSTRSDRPAAARRDRPRFRDHRALRHLPRIRARRGDRPDQCRGRGRRRSRPGLPAHRRRGRGGAAPAPRCRSSGCRAAAIATAGRSYSLRRAAARWATAPASTPRSCSAVGLHFMKEALAEMRRDRQLYRPRRHRVLALRKEIEDLIGLDAYYRIEAATVEPDSRPG